jgi:outer membrane biosynthesis protein TonB
LSPHRLFSKLLFQLVPAVVVAITGIVLLSSLNEPVPPAAPTGAADTAITTEAVFTPTPKAPEPEQKVAHAKPKPAAANAARPHKVVASEPAPEEEAAAPLPIVPVAEAPQPAAAETASSGIVDKMRGVTASVQALPQRAYSKMASWFAPSEPLRPPADVPERFNAVAEGAGLPLSRAQ